MKSPITPIPLPNAVSVSFSYTGDVQYWTSPANCASSIQVDLQGASGGVDYYWTSCRSLTGNELELLSLSYQTHYMLYILEESEAQEALAVLQVALEDLMEEEIVGQTVEQVVEEEVISGLLQAI
jgi:hypothetical protein